MTRISVNRVRASRTAGPERLAGLTILLAACSPQPDTANQAVANETVANETAANAEIPAAPEPVANTAMPPFAEVPNAHPTAPDPAPIPAKFRGIWAETKAYCSNLQGETRLVISGTTLRWPSAVLVGTKFSIPAPDQFALEGKFEGSGETGAAHYSINAAGTVLTDQAGGGMVRVRCG